MILFYVINFLSEAGFRPQKTGAAILPNGCPASYFARLYTISLPTLFIISAL